MLLAWTRKQKQSGLVKSPQLVGFEAREPMGFCTTLNGTKTAGFFG
jgi:hypothetical protein